MLQQRRGVVQDHQVGLAANDALHLPAHPQPTVKAGLLIQVGGQQDGDVHVALEAGPALGHRAEEVGRHHVRLGGQIFTQSRHPFAHFS